MSAVVRSRFYWTFALAMGVLVLVAFSRTYYLRAWFDVPPITMLLHLHSIVFSAWVALFLVQTRLIAARNYETHRRFGMAGVALAVLVVALGVVTAIETAKLPRPRPMGMSSSEFMLVPLAAVTFFAVLVAAAVALRKRAQLHKRLMVLAMISVLGPPVGRLILLTQTGEHFLAIQMAVPAAFVAWCLLSDWRRHRIIHPVYAVGGAVLVLS